MADASAITSGPTVKFPRTCHLADAGGSAVTRDDLLMTADDCETFLGRGAVHATVEEKVDGANLGISIDKETQQIMFQNRSHFVNASTAAQWSGLTAWISEHKFELYELLEPGRHILFGEWCLAQHSIFYSSLPDRFIVRSKQAISKRSTQIVHPFKPQAFDVYDQKEGAFYSVKRRNAFLKGTSLCVVPTVASGHFADADSLKPLLDTPSAYCDGKHPVEGIVVRIDDDTETDPPSQASSTPPSLRPNGHLLRRGKFVRADFVQGIEEAGHWSKGALRKNIVHPAHA